VCECWSFKRRRKIDFILGQNGKTNKFVTKEAFNVPYFEFTSRKRVTYIHCVSFIRIYNQGRVDDISAWFAW
jgi:hypothetical protein